MNAVTKTQVIFPKNAIEDTIFDKAMGIMKQAQQDLKREDAIVGDNVDSSEEVQELSKIPYDTELIRGKNTISLVPTFDNAIDEYSNSDIISKFGFEGNMTLTKLRNKLQS